MWDRCKGALERHAVALMPHVGVRDYNRVTIIVTSAAIAYFGGTRYAVGEHMAQRALRSSQHTPRSSHVAVRRARRLRGVPVGRRPLESLLSLKGRPGLSNKREQQRTRLAGARIAVCHPRGQRQQACAVIPFILLRNRRNRSQADPWCWCARCKRANPRPPIADRASLRPAVPPTRVENAAPG